MSIFAICAIITIAGSVVQADIRHCDFDEFVHSDISISYSTTADLMQYQNQYGYSKGQYGKFALFKNGKKLKVMPVFQQQQVQQAFQNNVNINDALSENKEKEEEEEEEQEILPIWKLSIPLNTLNFTLVHAQDNNLQFSFDVNDEDEWSNFTAISRSSFSRTLDVTSKNVLALDNWYKIVGTLKVSKLGMVDTCYFVTVVRACESYSSCSDSLVNIDELVYKRLAGQAVYELQTNDIPYSACKALLTLIPTAEDLRCVDKIGGEKTNETAIIYPLTSTIITVPLAKEYRYRYTVCLIGCVQSDNASVDILHYLRSTPESYAVPECGEERTKRG